SCLAEAVAGAGLDEGLEGTTIRWSPARQIQHVRIGPTRNDRLRLLLPHTVHVAQPYAHGPLLDRALRRARVHVGRQDANSAALTGSHEARRGVEAHRLRVEKGAKKLGRVVVA